MFNFEVLVKFHKFAQKNLLFCLELIDLFFLLELLNFKVNKFKIQRPEIQAHNFEKFLNFEKSDF